jgi:hypothetical protein
MFFWRKKPIAARPKLIVLANCTHVSLALVLRKSGLFSQVDSLEVYSVPEGDRQREAENLATADMILTIEHGEGFGPLSTAGLQQRYPGRVFSLPTPFFSGTVPDMAYLLRGGAISRAPAMMGDYHSALLLLECQSGYTEADIVARYESGESFRRMDVKGIWDDNLRELQSRELGTSIRISDYIEARAAEGKIGEDFLSFNHPKEGLVNHIAQSFAKVALGPKAVIPPLRADEHNLYQDALWPVHPAVSEILGLPVPQPAIYKAPDRLGGARMDIRDFALRSCRFFNEGDGCGEFQIVTPAYLRNRMV